MSISKLKIDKDYSLKKSIDVLIRSYVFLTISMISFAISLVGLGITIARYKGLI